MCSLTMKHTRVVSTKCTLGFACRAFSDTNLVWFIVNEHTTKCSHYILKSKNQTQGLCVMHHIWSSDDPSTCHFHLSWYIWYMMLQFYTFKNDCCSLLDKLSYLDWLIERYSLESFQIILLNWIQLNFVLLSLCIYIKLRQIMISR